MTTVVVTGASGFIGRRAVAALLDSGADVHTVDRGPSSAPGDVRHHVADLLDDDDARRLCDDARADTLLHLAWVTRPGAFWSDATNVDWLRASLALVRAFVAAGGRRVVGVGTAAEYADADRCSEGSTPLAPSSLYATTKRALGDVLGAAGPVLGIETAWARIFQPYGPGENPQRLVPTVVRSILAGEKVPCTAGTQVRDFIHVDDVGRGLAALALSTATGPFNVGTGRATAVARVATTLGGLLGHPELVCLGAIAEAGDAPARLVADVRRGTDQLGWRAALDLEEGLAATIEWWRAQS